MRDSEQLALWANLLVDDERSMASGAWPRAAALLGRSALEASMSELWVARNADITDASRRAQLLCLPNYVDSELATDIAYTYSALSSACHHHPYDLPPTAPEIRHWLKSVDRLISASAAAAMQVEGTPDRQARQT